MLSALQKIPQTLLSVSEKVFHYEAYKQTDSYIVWAEDSEGDSVEADDQKVNQSIQGTIDFYTKTDMDPMVDEIQNALIAAHISFYLNSTEYEDETQYIHYEWVFEVA